MRPRGRQPAMSWPTCIQCNSVPAGLRHNREATGEEVTPPRLRGYAPRIVAQLERSLLP